MLSETIKEELMAYLYNEMSADERLVFEQKLATDAALMQELEQLSDVRNNLAGISDKDIVAPVMSYRKEVNLRSGWLSNGVKPILAIAASLTLLLVAGYVTNFQLSFIDGDMNLSFGKPTIENTQHIYTEAEIKNMLQAEIAKSNNELLAASIAWDEKVDERYNALEKTVKNIDKRTNKLLVTKEEIDEYFTLAQSNNKDAMREFMATATLQQQQYLKAIFTEYNDYLQEQRQEDLAIIRTGFIEMKQTQTQQKLQTDQVLASLLSTVSAK